MSSLFDQLNQVGDPLLPSDPRPSLIVVVSLPVLTLSYTLQLTPSPGNGPSQAKERNSDTLSFPCDGNALQAQLEAWTNVAFDFDSPDFGDADNQAEVKAASPTDDRSTMRYAAAFAHKHVQPLLQHTESTTVAPELTSTVDLNALLGAGAASHANVDPFGASSVVDSSLSLPPFGGDAPSFPSFFAAAPTPSSSFTPLAEESPLPAELPAIPTPAKTTKGKKAAAAASAAAAAEREKKKRAPSAKVAAKLATAHKELPLPEGVDTSGMTEEQLNALAIEEDKRRRNTAASARFRVKKKQREAALEQSAKELRDRVAALEKEVETLRTENGWLRGLIVDKTAEAAAANAGLGGAANNRKRAREEDDHVDSSSILV
ncbi:hypothetical protein JCM11251_004555 [Rhodosporidiobolus azoricus]